LAALDADFSGLMDIIMVVPYLVHQEQGEWLAHGCAQASLSTEDILKDHS
jgi:hypothetical protein